MTIDEANADKANADETGTDLSRQDFSQRDYSQQDRRQLCFHNVLKDVPSSDPRNVPLDVRDLELRPQAR